MVSESNFSQLVTLLKHFGYILFHHSEDISRLPIGKGFSLSSVLSFPHLTPYSADRSDGGGGHLVLFPFHQENTISWSCLM